MKELSIEQKAKAYDEVTKKVNDYYEGKTKIYSDVNKTLNYLFPELKEEDENERIRKALITFFQKFPYGSISEAGTNVKEAISWLERQGKQNPDESKQETKPNGGIVYEDFNEGDGYYKVNLAYLSKEQVEEIETLVLKWNSTNEDIKNCIGMCLTDADEQRFKDYGTNLKECLDWLEEQAQKPSEYEDREYACQSSEHYTRRELMIYNLGIADGKRMIKETEQKPADEIGNYDHGKVLDSLMSTEMKTPEESLSIDSDIYNKIVDDCLFGEQKSVDEVKPKFKVGQTIIYKGTENIAPTKMTISDIAKEQYWDDNCCIVPISDQDNWELVEQKPAWSEEDESLRRRCIGAIDMANLSDYTKDGLLNWLKSLRPQNTWKPSMFHLECISDAIAIYEKRGINAIGLKEILEQLKKLKG